MILYYSNRKFDRWSISGIIKWKSSAAIEVSKLSVGNRAIDEIKKKIKASCKNGASKTNQNFKHKCKTIFDAGIPLKKLTAAHQVFHKTLEEQKHQFPFGAPGKYSNALFSFKWLTEFQLIKTKII